LSNPQEFHPPEQFEDFINVSDVIQNEGLKYIAGYAASRFRNKYPFLETPTKLLADSDEDWINHISKGGIERQLVTLLHVYTCSSVPRKHLVIVIF